MYTLKFLVYLIVFSFNLFHLAKSSSDNNQTCELAKSFSKTSPPNDKVHVQCEVDKSCAGFHCKGVYLVDNRQLHIKKGDPVCFGAVINRCDKPLSMDVYLQSVLVNSSFQKRLHHNASMKIPGTTLKSSPIQADLFVFVEMTHEDNLMTIALTAKIRIMMGKIIDWPSGLNFKVIPEQTFRVPPCPAGEDKKVTPIPVFPTCSAPKVIPRSTVKPLSGTYGKPCDPTQVYQCGKNEMCTFNKTCDCATGMIISPSSGYCDNPNASPTPKNAVSSTTTESTSTNFSSHLPSNAPQVADKKPEKSKTGLITGLAVGAVAFLGIIILISFFVWRSRSTQFDHIPIVENEEVVI